MNLRLLFRFAVVGFAGCMVLGCAPKGSKHPSVTRDFVAEFDAVDQRLRGECMAVASAVDVAESKVDALSYTPDRRATRRAKWKRFRKALSACLSGIPLERSMAIRESLNTSKLAPLFGQASPNLEDKELLSAIGQILNGFEECAPLQAEEIAGFGRRVSDEGRTWAQDRMVILNEMVTLVIGFAVPESNKLLSGGLAEYQRKADALVKAVSDGHAAVKKDYSATLDEKKRLMDQETTLRARNQALSDAIEQCRSTLSGVAERRTKLVEETGDIIRKIGRRR